MHPIGLTKWTKAELIAANDFLRSLTLGSPKLIVNESESTSTNDKLSRTLIWLRGKVFSKYKTSEEFTPELIWRNLRKNLNNTHFYTQFFHSLTNKK